MASSRSTATRATSDRLSQLRSEQRPSITRVQSGDSIYEARDDGRPELARVQSGDSIREIRGDGGAPLVRVQSGDSVSELRPGAAPSLHGELDTLDPSPMEGGTPVGWSDWRKETTAYFEEKKHGQTFGLGLGEHSSIWWLSRVQRYSSYVFAGFLGMHITNTSLIPLATRSIPASDSYLLLTRPYYQSPLFEPLVVLAPAALHVASGLGLRLLRRRQNLRWYGGEHLERAERRSISWPKVSGTSALGMLLAPAILAHGFVNRAIPLKLEGGSSGIGLGYVAHGFAKHPWLMTAAYVPLIGIAALHVVWGSATWLGLAPGLVRGVDAQDRKIKHNRRWWATNALAALVAGLWAAGGLGVVARGGLAGGWQGKHWDAMYRHIPLVGSYL